MAGGLRFLIHFSATATTAHARIYQVSSHIISISIYLYTHIYTYTEWRLRSQPWSGVLLVSMMMMKVAA